MIYSGREEKWTKPSTEISGSGKKRTKPPGNVSGGGKKPSKPPGDLSGAGKNLPTPPTEISGSGERSPKPPGNISGHRGRASEYVDPSTKNADFYGGDYNLISPADLDNGKYVRSAHKTLTKEGFEKCRTVPRGSVLVGCIGNVGKLGMVADDRSTTNQQINSIIPNSDFNPHFLYYALQFCRPRLEKAAAKVTLPILNKSNFESFQIAAPERKEQEDIAGHLGILDQKLENAGQTKSQLEDLFRTLLHELMIANISACELQIPELAT